MPSEEQQTPASPMTELAAGAAQAHEMMMTYVAAGFERHEALYLVAVILTAGIRPSPPQP